MKRKKVEVIRSSDHIGIKTKINSLVLSYEDLGSELESVEVRPMLFEEPTRATELVLFATLVFVLGENQ